MKKYLLILSAAFAFIFLAGCTAQKSTPQNLQRKWMLVEFQNFSKDLLQKREAFVDLSPRKAAKNQYSAKMGCNNMFFTAEFKGAGRIKVSGLGSTMMYCDKAMDLETEFGKIFPTMTNYKVEGHFLTLSGGGRTMKFVAADWD